MPEELNLDNPNPPNFPATFDATVLEGGGYVSRDGMWSAHVNNDLIAVWGADDVLGRAAIVDRLSSRMRARFNRYRGTAGEPRTWADAGNFVHHALRLGLIREETTAAGERGWRLLDREPHWIIVGTGCNRECRQVRGLPPEQQAAVYKAEATARKRNATLDRKARAKADPVIDGHVRNILRADPATTVSAWWVRMGWVPEWLSGSRLDASAKIVREAHHAAEMDRPTLKEWIWNLNIERTHATVRAEERDREQAALPEHAEIPDTDADALGGLA